MLVPFSIVPGFVFRRILPVCQTPLQQYKYCSIDALFRSMLGNSVARGSYTLYNNSYRLHVLLYESSVVIQVVCCLQL